jgi:hypothetical protein
MRRAGADRRGCARSLGLQAPFSRVRRRGADVTTRAQLPSSGKRSEHDLANGRVLKERQNKIAMPIEPSRPPHDWHDPIGSCELEQAIDFRIIEALGDTSQCHLGLELR